MSGEEYPDWEDDESNDVMVESTTPLSDRFAGGLARVLDVRLANIDRAISSIQSEVARLDDGQTNLWTDIRQLEDVVSALQQPKANAHQEADMTGHPQTRIMLLEHELTAVRQQRDELLAVYETLVEGILWCGGSPSFAPWGEAHEGWVKLHKRVVEPAVELIAKAKGG